MKEYELLRQEILDSLNAIVQYNTLLYTVTVAILAFAFEKENPFLCLIPYVAIIPIYFMTDEYRRGFNQLAAYMIVFLEGKEHNWESRLFEFHHQHRNETNAHNILWNIRHLGQSSQAPYVVSSQMPYAFLAVACSMFTLYKIIISNDTNTEKLISIFVVVLITALTLIIMIRLSKKYFNLKEYYITEWQAVKAAEEARKRDNTRNPQ